MSPFLPAGWKLKERKLVRQKLCMGLEFGSETLRFSGGQSKDGIWNDYYEMVLFTVVSRYTRPLQALIGTVFRFISQGYPF
jgi:hypothetical protein